MKTEFKGTKERWEVEYVARQESMRASVNNGSIDVWADINGVSIEEANANALLISKAPEMLEMLQGILYSQESGDTFHSCKIAELIKQATTL